MRTLKEGPPNFRKLPIILKSDDPKHKSGTSGPKLEIKDPFPENAHVFPFLVAVLLIACSSVLIRHTTGFYFPLTASYYSPCVCVCID